MLSGELWEIIQNIERENTLKPRLFDSEAVVRLKELPLENSNFDVREADFQVITKILRQRWSSVQDTSLDYTLEQYGINQYWIALARGVSDSIHNQAKSWLQLLIPSINSQEMLDVITGLNCELSDIILSDDGTTLYSFSALCKMDSLAGHLRLGDVQFTDKERWRIKKKQEYMPSKKLRELDSIRIRTIVNLYQNLEHLSVSEKADCDATLIAELKKQFQGFDQDALLRPQDCAFLVKIYQKRWLAISQTAFKYTRKLNGANRLWLNLAKNLDYWQCLNSGMTYYHLLMPTLRNGEEDNVLKRRITDYELSHCILNDYNTELIFLDLSIDYFKHNGSVWGAFSEVETSTLKLAAGFRKFSLSELVQIKYSAVNEVYRSFVLPKLEQTLSITFKTYKELLFLVNDSFLAKGLSLSGDYSASESYRANLVYKRFGDYLSSLNSVELNALFAQRMTLGGCAYTFAEIWNDIVREEQCLAVNSQLFIKLLLNYCANPKFSIEAKKVANEFHNEPSQRAFAEDHILSETQFENVLLFFDRSIECNEFQTATGTGVSIKVGNARKVVPDSVSKIHQLLHHQQALQASKKYSMIMETVLIPKLLNPSYGRKLSTNRWLLGGIILPYWLLDIRVLLSRIFSEWNNFLLLPCDKICMNALIGSLVELYTKMRQGYKCMAAEFFNQLCCLLYAAFKDMSLDYQEYFIHSVLTISSRQSTYLLHQFEQNLKEVLNMDEQVLTPSSTFVAEMPLSQNSVSFFPKKSSCTAPHFVHESNLVMTAS